MMLVDGATAQALDRTAIESWSLSELSLVETAGRACAAEIQTRLTSSFKGDPQTARVVLLAGSGNNGADGMVLLRTLLLHGIFQKELCSIILTTSILAPLQTTSHTEVQRPGPQILQVLKQMGLPCMVWAETEQAHLQETLDRADILIDAITGSGLKGPLSGTGLAMAEAAGKVKSQRPNILIIAVDVPSGMYDGWKQGDPILRADWTVAIEPVKTCVYMPALRPLAGVILPIQHIFPADLLEQCSRTADFLQCQHLVEFNSLAVRAASMTSTSKSSSSFVLDSPLQDPLRVPPDSYKHRRGVVVIHAGAPGTSGAPFLAGRGAQAGGAGLVQLVLDEAMAPAYMAVAGGMLVSTPQWEQQRPIAADALVVGSGWGWGEERKTRFELLLEKARGEGLALVLDADAIVPAAAYDFFRDIPTVLTPHGAEFIRFIRALRERGGRPVPSEQELMLQMYRNPLPLLLEAREAIGATILLKTHVMYVVPPAGPCYIIDGMEPVLAMGGTGDVLSGLLAALMARMRRTTGSVDTCLCCQWAAAILVEGGRQLRKERGFSDPLVLAEILGKIAGTLWL
ncbi:MAG: bifunctional ADP-dependent NAD(P)H-hydrate dehydratase/NAD(P)H-hydrate epimerase [Termitinemataceae bacterium]